MLFASCFLGAMGSQKRPKVGPGIESSVGFAPVDPLAGNLGMLHSWSAGIILPSYFLLWCVRVLGGQYKPILLDDLLIRGSPPQMEGEPKRKSQKKLLHGKNIRNLSKGFKLISSFESIFSFAGLMGAEPEPLEEEFVNIGLWFAWFSPSFSLPVFVLFPAFVPFLRYLGSFLLFVCFSSLLCFQFSCLGFFLLLWKRLENGSG